MRIITPRRFKRLHEQILLSSIFLLAVNWIVSVGVPYVGFWSWQELLYPDSGQKVALWATSIACTVSYVAAIYLRNLHPGGRTAGLLISQTIVIYILTALVVMMAQLNVSRYLLLASGVCAVVWQYIEFAVTYKYQRLKLGIITQGQYTDELMQLSFIDACP